MSDMLPRRMVGHQHPECDYWLDPIGAKARCATSKRTLLAGILDCGVHRAMHLLLIEANTTQPPTCPVRCCYTARGLPRDAEALAGNVVAALSQSDLTCSRAR
jgi:hypothetical protein